MTPAIQKNLISGAGLIVFGALYSIYAITQLPIGTFSSMGPGMFPMLVGFILIVTGGLIAAPAVLEAMGQYRSDQPAGKWDAVEIKSLFYVLAAMAAFATLLEPFGIALSAFVLVGICSLASDKLKWPVAIAVALVLITSTYVIFIWALKMPLDLVNWPF